MFPLNRISPWNSSLAIENKRSIFPPSRDRWLNRPQQLTTSSSAIDKTAYFEDQCRRASQQSDELDLIPFRNFILEQFCFWNDQVPGRHSPDSFFSITLFIDTLKRCQNRIKKSPHPNALLSSPSSKRKRHTGVRVCAFDQNKNGADGFLSSKRIEIVQLQKEEKYLSRYNTNDLREERKCFRNDLAVPRRSPSVCLSDYSLLHH